MRVRTDEKRQEILSAAIALFTERGLQSVSMAAIADRIGISKATLYGYYASKDELFAEAMVHGARETGEAMLALLNADDAPPAVLSRFADAYLRFATQPEIIAHARVAIGDGPRSRLGPLLYQLGQRRMLKAIEAYLEKVTAAGLLSCRTPDIAALQFKGMLEAGTVLPLLYGTLPQVDFHRAASAAAEAFIMIYGTTE